MEKLLTSVTGLLADPTSLVVQQHLTQSSSGHDDTVVWLATTAPPSDEVRNEMRSMVARRGSRYYTTGAILPYADFCIALVCCHGYTLNHNRTPQVPPRAYAAAWRAIQTAADVGTQAVKKWLDDNLRGRTAAGYAITHSVSFDSTPQAPGGSIHMSGGMSGGVPREVMSSALRSGKVTRVELYDNDQCLALGGIPSTCSTPQSLLASVVAHHEYVTASVPIDADRDR